MSCREVVLSFFEYWKSTGFVDHKFFSDDFVFISPSLHVDAEAWLMNSEVELPMENIVVIEEIVDGTRAVLLFEAVDPVTLLIYRTAWFFHVDEEKITRIIEIRHSISPSSRITAYGAAGNNGA